MNNINLNALSIQFTNTVYQIFTNVSEKTYKLFFTFLLVFVVIFSGLKFYSGLSPIRAPWDVIMLLNGGWRIYSGQIPHTDYYNPIGPLAYIPIALGMRIGGISSSSLVYGNAVFGVILALWAWYTSRNRLTALNTFIFSIFIYVLSISSRPLGYGIKDFTYAMIYNRYGYALLSILFVQLFIPLRRNDKTEKLIDSILVGVVLVFLFYCKVTYFLVGAAAVVVSILISKNGRDQFLVHGISFAGSILLIWTFFHINPLHYINDIQTAGFSQSFMARFANLTGTIKDNYVFIYLMFPLVFLTFIAKSNPAVSIEERNESRFLWVVAALIIVSAIFITSGNATERKDIPLFFTAGIIILNSLARNPVNKSTSDLSKVEIVSLFVVLIVIPLFLYPTVKDIGSIVFSAGWNKANLPALDTSQRFRSDAMFDFVIPGNSDWRTAYSFAKDVPKRLNDGFILLQKYVDKDSRVFCLCFTDPFSFGLGLQPARGTPLWWDEGFSFTDKVFPEPQSLFTNVDFVVIPVLDSTNEGCCTSTVYLLEDIYGEYLDTDFREMDRSDYWIVLARR